MKAVCALLLLTIFVVAEGYGKKGYYQNPYRRFFHYRGGYGGDFDDGFIGYNRRFNGDYLGGRASFIGGVNPGFTGFSRSGRFGGRFFGGRSRYFGTYGGDDFGDDGFGDDGFSGAFSSFGSFNGRRSYNNRGRSFHWQYDRCKCQRKCGKYKIYVGKCKTCRKCKLVMCCRNRRPKKGFG